MYVHNGTYTPEGDNMTKECIIEKHSKRLREFPYTIQANGLTIFCQDLIYMQNYVGFEVDNRCICLIAKAEYDISYTDHTQEEL